jgi:hypothetical protein
LSSVTASTRSVASVENTTTLPSAESLASLLASLPVWVVSPSARETSVLPAPVRVQSKTSRPPFPSTCPVTTFVARLE